MTPSAFIFLYENNLFLTFRNRTVAVWNFRGELVTSFEDHLLWHHDCSTNNIYITCDQDLIISYCKSETLAEDGTGAVVITLTISLKKILYQLYRWISFYISSGTYQYIQSHTHRLDDSTVNLVDLDIFVLAQNIQKSVCSINHSVKHTVESPLFYRNISDKLSSHKNVICSDSSWIHQHERDYDR
jgi:hypothetical protein